MLSDRHVRVVWNDETEEYYFSVVDVVGVLTDSPDPAAYWRKLKQRLKKEGNETVTNCHGLNMIAVNGKYLKGEGNETATICSGLKK